MILNNYILNSSIKWELNIQQILNSILILLLLSLIVIFLFGILYFLFYLGFNKIKEIFKTNYFIDKLIMLFFGAIIGFLIPITFSFLNSYLLDNNISSYTFFTDNKMILIIQLTIIFIFSIYMSFFISLSSSIILFIINFTSTDLNNLENLNYLIYLSIMIAVSVIFIFFYRFFVSEMSLKKIIYCAMILYAIYLLIYNVMLSIDFNLYIFYTFIFYFIYFILLKYAFIVIFYNISNILISTYKLQKSIKYDDIFVNNNNSLSEFNKYVKKNEISYGLMFKLDIKNLNIIAIKNGESVKKEVENKVIKTFINKIGVNNFFFKDEMNEKVFFINLVSEDFKKEINELFNIVNKLQRKVKFKKEIYEISYKVLCTIYGVHSCDFNELRKNLFYCKLKNISDLNKNEIYIYDGINEKYNNDLIKTNEINRTNKNVSKQIEFMFFEHENNKFIKPKYNNNDYHNIRYINNYAIEQFKFNKYWDIDTKLNIIFDIDSLNDQWYFGYFINKISKEKISLNNIYITPYQKVKNNMLLNKIKDLGMNVL